MWRKRRLNAMAALGTFSMLVFVNWAVVPTRLIAQGAIQRGQKIPPASGWADTILVNGKIATMNESQKFVEALAVRGDRIAAVGTRKQIESYAGPQSKVIDLKGKTVVPGLVDPHEHPHLWISFFHNSGSKLNPQWETLVAIGKTPEEAAANILRTVQEGVQQRKPDEWIMVRTDEDGGRAMSTGMVTSEQLDKLAPNNPVFIGSEILDFLVGKTGKGLTNIEAIKRADEGYGVPLRSTVQNMLINSKGKEIFEADGLDTRELRGTTTRGNIIFELIPKAIGLDTFAEAIRREIQFWAETQGVTTVVTTWFRVPNVLSAHSILAKQRRMPGRVGWYTWHEHHFFGSQEGVAVIPICGTWA